MEVINCFDVITEGSICNHDYFYFSINRTEIMKMINTCDIYIYIYIWLLTMVIDNDQIIIVYYQGMCVHAYAGVCMYMLVIIHLMSLI